MCTCRQGMSVIHCHIKRFLKNKNSGFIAWKGLAIANTTCMIFIMLVPDLYPPVFHHLKASCRRKLNNSMKKYVFMLAALLVVGSLFVQDASSAGQAASGGAMDSIQSVAIACFAGAFLFIIIFALARAVKALTTQVTSWKRMQNEPGRQIMATVI